MKLFKRSYNNISRPRNFVRTVMIKFETAKFAIEQYLENRELNLKYNKCNAKCT